MNPLLEQFLQEARENLKFIETHIEELDGGDDELLNSIFRAAHTLKGGSGIVGFEAIKNITHKAEDLLDNLRSKKIEFKRAMIDVLYDAFDEVLNLVEAAEQSGDIVEGNIEIEERVIDSLLDMMGEKREEAPSFEAPFKSLDDPSIITNRNFSALSELECKIPFEYESIDEENLNNKRLYGVLFDVDENCMEFGNDPIYVLSLLKDALVGVDLIMHKESSLKLLESQDPTLLVSEICALIYGSYQDIEDALYNFLDDLLILPLDIKTLLKITPLEDENRSSKDLLKDIATPLNEAIKDGDFQRLSQTLNKAYEIINVESFESRAIVRFLECLHLICDEELEKCRDFITLFGESLDDEKELEKKEVEESKEIEENENLDREEVEDKKSSNEKESAQNLEVSKNLKSAKEITQIDRDMVVKILKEQLYQIEKDRTSEVLNRAEYITRCCFAFVESEGLKDRDVESAIRAYLGEKIESAKVEQKSEKTLIKKEVEVQKEAPKVAVKKDVIGKVVKVEQESIDSLMSVVGELLVAKNSLPYLAEASENLDSESIKRAILEKYSFINRLTNQLQDLIMSMRMLPISYVFDRYPKLVREISKKLNKRVRLLQDGGDTKLDKNMIEMLADPLIHIVRNSLDHGIESPELRKEKGKDENGEIVMKAYPQSDKVIIEVHDDGAGIDTDRLVKKVLDKNLVPIERIEEMSQDELVQLITLPGLSTAETISEYSGRGVGMDVVRKSLEEFGGSLEIKSKLGMGTQIKLSIPVSLAVTTLLHIYMNQNHYGFPMENVSETVKLNKNEITYLHNEPFINLREQVIPLLYIDSMIDKESLNSEALAIVVLNIKGNPLAVVVNELLGQLDVVQKPLEGVLKSHPIISGTALLGNGQIIMILDPYSLLTLQDALKSKKESKEIQDDRSLEDLSS